MIATEEEPKSRFTPNRVANSERLFDIRLSPDAKQLLYLVKPLYKPDECDTCAIWTGDVGHPESAKQFTSGLFNDYSARFHPDGKRLVFLSDRHKAGGPAQLYSITLHGGEAVPLFGKANKRGISEFEISPDRRFIAFSSADEPTPEDERHEKERDDPQVFGDKRNFDHLRLYSFATGDVRTLDATKGSHVYHFVWASDSRSLFFLTRSHSALEFSAEKANLQKISIVVRAQLDVVGSYPRHPSGLCPLSTGEIVDIQAYEPDRMSDSKSVFVHSAHDFTKSTQLHGKLDDAVRIVDLLNDGPFAIEVAKGLDSRIVVFDTRKGSGSLLYQTENEDVERGSWDARKRADGTVVLVVIKSLVVRQEPPNIWTAP